MTTAVRRDSRGKLLFNRDQGGKIIVNGNTPELPIDIIKKYGAIFGQSGNLTTRSRQNAKKLWEGFSLYLDADSADTGSATCIIEGVLGKPDIIRETALRSLRLNDFMTAKSDLERLSMKWYRRYEWKFPNLISADWFTLLLHDNRSGGDILRDILSTTAPRGTGERANGGILHALFEEILRSGLDAQSVNGTPPNKVRVDAKLSGKRLSAANTKAAQTAVSAYAGVFMGTDGLRGNENATALSNMFKHIIRKTMERFRINVAPITDGTLSSTAGTLIRPLFPYDYAVFKSERRKVTELADPVSQLGPLNTRSVPKLGKSREPTANELRYTGKERMDTGKANIVDTFYSFPDQGQAQYRRKFRPDVLIVSDSDLKLWKLLSDEDPLDVYGFRLLRNVAAIELKTTDQTSGDAPRKEAMSIWRDYLTYQFSGVLFVIVTTKGLKSVNIFQFSTNPMYSGMVSGDRVISPLDISGEGIDIVQEYVPGIGTQYYVIERIEGERRTDENGIEYKIKWKNYDERTWEPRSKLIQDIGAEALNTLVTTWSAQ